jgi:hypothetical protein
MLAQNFKTAEELGISEAQKDALSKTLVLLETGKLKHTSPPDDFTYLGGTESFTGQFNMNCWRHTFKECGSICCIGGTAELIGNVDFTFALGKLQGLFYPPIEVVGTDWGRITPSQAATALRSYLTTGDARWDLAVAKSIE